MIGGWGRGGKGSFWPEGGVTHLYFHFCALVSVLGFRTWFPHLIVFHLPMPALNKIVKEMVNTYCL